MEEIWKPIKGYEGYYEASNLGNIRNSRTMHLIKQTLNTAGYLRVQLSKASKVTFCLVHRLVAEAFLDKTGPQVNHKNEIKTDNRVENLEWCDVSYNCRYGTRRERIVEKQGRPVIQMSLSGSVINTYPSLQEASRETGINFRHIKEICSKPTGVRKTAGGYKWGFKNV